MDKKEVIIPKFIAEWLEYCKKHDFTLFGCFDPVGGFEDLAGETFRGDIRKCVRWCRKESNTFAIAWLHGYKVKEEEKYIVKFKNIVKDSSCLKYDCVVGKWYFGKESTSTTIRLYHTKEELEAGGFNEVFYNSMFEIVEVKE